MDKEVMLRIVSNFLDNIGVEYINCAGFDFLIGDVAINCLDTLHANESYNETVTKKSLRDYTLECKEKGIRLITLFESEMTNIHLYLNFLATNKKRYNHVDTKRRGKNMNYYDIIPNLSITDFLKKYHRQGGSGKTNSFTAVDKITGEHLAVMNFRKTRNSSKGDYELFRLAVKPYISVFGFPFKAMNMFLEANDYPSISTYCDFRLNACKLYENLGFEQINTSLPNYKWVNFKTGEFNSRESFQRHKLAKRFNKPEYEGTKLTTGLGELEIGLLEGYCRVYDCGNYIYFKEGLNG